MGCHHPHKHHHRQDEVEGLTDQRRHHRCRNLFDLCGDNRPRLENVEDSPRNCRGDEVESVADVRDDRDNRYFSRNRSVAAVQNERNEDCHSHHRKCRCRWI